MSEKGSGYYIEYRKKSGEIQKAQVFHKEQLPALGKRIYCHLLTSDLMPQIDTNGKKLVSLIHLEQQTRIFGYFD